MTRLPLTIAYAVLFDKQFILGDGVFYSAELVYVGALDAGSIPGFGI